MQRQCSASLPEPIERSRRHLHSRTMRPHGARFHTSLTTISMEKGTDRALRGPDSELEASAHTGKTLYRHVCRLLAASFGCRGVWIGTVEGPDAPELHVLAACDHGTPVESFPLSLAGSPCEPVLRDGQLVVRAGLHEQFPTAPQHQLRGSEAYAGRAIVDNGGRVRGLIALSDDRPFDDPEAVARLDRKSVV